MVNLKKSEAIKRMWQNPENMKKHSEAMKKIWSSKEYKIKLINIHKINAAKQSRMMKSKWKNQSYRINQCNSLKKKWGQLEYKQRMKPILNKLIKKRWDDPKQHELAKEKMKEKWKDEEYKQKKSESTRKQWRDPEYKAKQLENIKKATKKQWQNPKLRSIMIKAIGLTSKARWDNPEWRANMSKDKSAAWKGGKSFEEYNIEFNRFLRKKIRERDNYTCFICKKIGKSVHHIDYNKDNCNPINLITLCNSDHIRTNWNRQKWIEFFKINFQDKFNEKLNIGPTNI